MVPKPVYESLPVLYVAAAVLTLVFTDSLTTTVPALLLLAAALVILYRRLSFRQLPARERMQRKAMKYSARYASRSR